MVLVKGIVKGTNYMYIYNVAYFVSVIQYFERFALRVHVITVQLNQYSFGLISLNGNQMGGEAKIALYNVRIVTYYCHDVNFKLL